MNEGLLFKIASEKSEFDQIHRLNYETFVEEIPQHERNSDGALVDKFHGENTYMICLDEGVLVGMLAVRDRRPFSLDHKIPALDTHLPQYNSACEIRLLSVKKERRYRKAILGLFTSLAAWCEEGGYDLALISANVTQERLYRNLGFEPFGPKVGTEGALYQPMYLTPGSYYGMKARMKLLSRMDGGEVGTDGPLNLLPGPVDVYPRAQRAMAEPPLSHRSDELIGAYEDVKRKLCALTGAQSVSILMGSGTLANDAVAGRLGSLGGRGLVLSNGEFGERLVDHALRQGLSFETLRKGWGEPFSRDEMERALGGMGGARWLWAVHSETSTGMLNDIDMLKAVSSERGVSLCLDCISSIGTVPLDLGGVWLATGVSGKGLRSYPGLSFVFRGGNEGSVLTAGPPRYIDLSLYEGRDGPPFTISSNLLYALGAALEDLNPETRYPRISEASAALRRRLRESGVEVVAPEGHESPALITIAPKGGTGSSELGSMLEKSGFFLNWRSRYLLQRNWIQVALMGEFTAPALDRLLDTMESILRPRRRA